jgi:hypothetical protein
MDLTWRKQQEQARDFLSQITPPRVGQSTAQVPIIILISLCLISLSCSFLVVNCLFLELCQEAMHDGHFLQASEYEKSR